MFLYFPFSSCLLSWFLFSCRWLISHCCEPVSTQRDIYTYFFVYGSLQALHFQLSLDNISCLLLFSFFLFFFFLAFWLRPHSKIMPTGLKGRKEHILQFILFFKKNFLLMFFSFNCLCDFEMQTSAAKHNFIYIR